MLTFLSSLTWQTWALYSSIACVWGALYVLYISRLPKFQHSLLPMDPRFTRRIQFIRIIMYGSLWPITILSVLGNPPSPPQFLVQRANKRIRKATQAPCNNIEF